MRKQLAAFAALALVAGAARAEGIKGSVDVYYVPIAEIEAGGGDHGDGFGARAAVGVMDGVVVTGEYQANGYQQADDLTQYRIGAGLVGESGLGLFAEYIKTDDAFAADGYAAHLRFGKEMVYGQVGYVRLNSDDLDDDVGGYEFTLGALIPFSETFEAFADVRRTGIGHDQSPFELEVTDVRAGVRFNFGGGGGTPPEPAEDVEVTEPAQ